MSSSVNKTSYVKTNEKLATLYLEIAVHSSSALITDNAVLILLMISADIGY